tara:strand:- start:1148 stop:2179 length:1032 start_codon:yes stop_codon:yes gene_type:complete
MKNKIALVSGITGQDGSYLCELLIKKNYKVYGIVRRSSSLNTSRIDHLAKNKKLKLLHGDILDTGHIERVISKIKPDEIYNLAAQSHVKVSFEIPDYTAQVDALATLRFLEAIRKINKKIKFYQASTSELYGNSNKKIQNELTHFEPRSPYAIAKLYSFWIVKNYRESYGIFASNGILFNHESPRRQITFVTKKITRGASRVKLGIDKKIILGNLYSHRDWGYAPEYVEGMWKMLQQTKPDDYVLATGKSYSIKDFVIKSFNSLDIEIKWEGKGIKEFGYDTKTNKKIVCIDKKFYRPTEVNFLKGNYNKAKRMFGWEPKTNLDELIKIMIKSDFNEQKKIIG